MRYFELTVADPDFYLPLPSADPGPRYAPSGLPESWVSTVSDVWTVWGRAGTEVAAQGWKIHVSSSAGNARKVLDIVAAACVEFDVRFKHLTGRNFFLVMHGKHSGRAQSGKFCALYPHDEQAAHELLRRLERDLAGVGGPYVLTDRRFGSSRCVSYRYGAFTTRCRLTADGSRVATMLAADGTEIDDERRPEFLLPVGIDDPFTQAEAPADGGPASFHGYTFESVLRHSNAGGAYRARTEDGRQVFVKEAKAHNGYTSPTADASHRLEQEYLTLRTLHARAPGLCPEPIDFFTHWEHTYLVTELVPGRTMQAWTVASSPITHVSPTTADVRAYYQRCQNILDELERTVTALHYAGYVFGDLSPGNVLIDDDDRPRLIDFESATRIGDPLTIVGTPGFVPPEAWTEDFDPRQLDEYALSSIALALLFPLHTVVDRTPTALDHLRADLVELAEVPSTLWHAATGSRSRPAGCAIPRPDEVRADPDTWLRWLRDATTDAVVSMAEPDNERHVYPTSPDGLRTNTRCVAHGTAGVLHALNAAGSAVDPAIVTRLRDDSLRAVDDTPPGLLFGTAGIAWVLADLGELDAAEELLTAATEHPLTRDCANLGGGAAGVAIAHLSRYCATGEQRHLEHADRLLAASPDDGRYDISGWAQGRPGAALALYYLARLTGQQEPWDRGLRLLRDELDRFALPMRTDAMGFRVSSADRRNVPYLQSGSAGFARVLARYLTRHDDPALDEALRQCVRSLTVRFTVLAGLFRGQAGMALVLGELGDLANRPDLIDAERAAGVALFKHAVAHHTGVRWIGDLGLRFSADLASGSAGVLLALNRMVERTGDPLFTLDRYLPVESPRPLVGSTH